MHKRGRLGPPPVLVAAMLAALLACLPGAAAAEIRLSPPDDRIREVSVEPTLKTGLASIQIYSSVKNAKLWIDKVDTAWIPYAADLAPGSHYLEVKVPGYYPLGAWFIFTEMKLYTIEFAPTRITGFLELKVEPKDAQLSVDGEAVKQGLNELGAGAHSLVAKRFGYVQRSEPFVIEAKGTKTLSLALDKAPFAVKGLAFSRKAFNPRNVGVVGRTSLDFLATSYGSARAEISGPDGSLVATLEYPSIEDWDQSRGWDGRSPEGEPLPDGVYTASLEALPKDGGEAVKAEAKVRIDSTIVISAFGSASGIPGLLYMPDPAPESAGTTVAETFYFLPLGGSASSGNPAFGLSGATSIAGIVTLALQAAAEASPDAGGSGDAAASVLAALFGDKESGWSGAFFLRGALSSIDSPSMPGAGNAVEATLPIAARLGGIGGADLRLALAPGGRALLGSAPSFLGLARAGLWLEGRAFRTGLSGELPFDFARGFSPSWPLKAALEGRLMLGSSPFVAALYSTGDFQPGASPRFGLGLGIGLLF